MKLNLGCGFNKLEGWVNVDKVLECTPDVHLNLELFPWPWPESSVAEVMLIHVLEHIGPNPSIYLDFVKELWRVSQPGTPITILVPHPRSDEFLWDPTHVRAITPEGLRMFSQARNRELILRNNPETPLGLYLGVDFEISEVKYIWRKPWSEKERDGLITGQDLLNMLPQYLNVAKEILIKMRVNKPAGQPAENQS